jgi:hypothetical protein
MINYLKFRIFLFFSSFNFENLPYLFVQILVIKTLIFQFLNLKNYKNNSSINLITIKSLSIIFLEREVFSLNLS